MKLIFYFLLVFLKVVDAFSQEGYTTGYIINYKGDTVRGKIKDRKDPSSLINWQKIHFINAKGEREKLTADEIKGYVKADSLEFRTLTLGLEEKRRLVVVAESGAVILFVNVKGPAEQMVQMGSSPFGAISVIVRMGGTSQKIVGDYYLQKSGDVNSLMEWRSWDKKEVEYFFKNDKEVTKEIEDNEMGIQTIVKKFNQRQIKK